MAPRKKRKRDAAEIALSSPPTKKSRRASGRDSVSSARKHKTRRTRASGPAALSDSDLEGAGSAVDHNGTPLPLVIISTSSEEEADLVVGPSRKLKRNTRRVAAHSDSEEDGEMTQPQLLSTAQDSEEEAESVVSLPKQKVRRKVVALSDSEDDGVADRPKKMLRRGKPSPSVPAEGDSDSVAASPRKRRLRRKDATPSDSEESTAEATEGNAIVQLGSEEEDLELPRQITSSKPTRRQVKESALERYRDAKARKNRSSPALVPEVASEEEEEELGFPEADDEGVDEDAENMDESFIVDDGDDDATAADAALGSMRYERRELEEHFKVFVEYIIELNCDPEFFSTADEDDQAYYESAVVALRRHIDPLADSITLSTWKAPFIATLNLRPTLKDGFSSEGDNNCHACWTRGRYSCDIGGSYTLSTQKGVYDPKTFEDMPEKKIKYGKKTQFENSAEAPNRPYPPDFQLIIGERCFNRALA
ncbi:hypothetical protein B0H10DRAFT_2022051 [Mycena sp. CBHHK59/15]|nr:hypothetical protein B0H10DRAFT_2022051 [Mycena sp. CBHHK59/15]